MTGAKGLKRWYRLPGLNGGPLDPQWRGGVRGNRSICLVNKGYPAENAAKGNQEMGAFRGEQMRNTRMKSPQNPPHAIKADTHP